MQQPWQQQQQQQQQPQQPLLQHNQQQQPQQGQPALPRTAPAPCDSPSLVATTTSTLTPPLPSASAPTVAIVGSPTCSCTYHQRPQLQQRLHRPSFSRQQEAMCPISSSQHRQHLVGGSCSCQPARDLLFIKDQGHDLAAPRTRTTAG
jgi:hypothetical protein